MAKPEREQALKGGKKRMGRPVSNVEAKERMTFWMLTALVFKLRALAFEKKVPYSTAFNDMVRNAPEPVIEIGEDQLPKKVAKYSSADERGLDKERITCWMEPAMANKLRTMAFIAGHVPNSKIASDLVRAAPTPKMSGG